MKLLLTRVRLAAACGSLALSLVFLSVLPASAERPSDAGQLLLWLLGLNRAHEQRTPRKVDVNSATVDELAAVPGMERRLAHQIAVNRPYTRLRDLVRAGLSPELIEHFAPLLTVDSDGPSAFPSPAKGAPPVR
jgi:DNA uptake protein ComE-like DNA-binding protein